MKMIEIPLGSSQLEPLAKLICSLPPQIEDQPSDPSAVQAICLLWNDPDVHQSSDCNGEYQLSFSFLLKITTAYHFDSIDWIGKPGYLPNDRDVLRSRVGRTGITATVFVIGRLNY
ncbi:uncharacterized protein MELLADRAFT_88881 [Melampsora larici-populina 98AG31]|uniref:Uncharacterized protein n=1 Tax=Melampsora larici-populina (strain 98AG31 / pathotype 3-4-7) TaxID=747676 RepID=F4R655_MELLP|nr:uncharacterized protein MELLADRAFT_88881 [Melampsora larici-populina 98AG31]EGG11827.1 hypothetical protein MELLADRAFT_88881 [Melampsora larici-populina 98AG31]